MVNETIAYSFVLETLVFVTDVCFLINTRRRRWWYSNDKRAYTFTGNNEKERSR